MINIKIAIASPAVNIYQDNFIERSGFSVIVIINIILLLHKSSSIALSDRYQIVKIYLQ